ncbi:phosphatase PAP2 family protein [Nocardia callitridis]|uniref:Phosphatase PAP2 family protein n=1 Tax=Nocardia callitridis TaxID=648753 RepID=A0ABP9K4F2_9NOCA
MLGSRGATASAATAAIAVGAMSAYILPTTFPDEGGPTGLDRVIAEPIHSTLDAHRGIAEVLVVVSNAYVLLPLLVLGCVWFAARREFVRAALMLVAPELVVAINTWLLKPLWDRRLHDYLAYPSGHTVHLVAIVTAFVVLARTPGARWSVLVMGIICFLAAAIGMIALDYHFPTDILGGAAAAIALTTALCVGAEKLHTEKTRKVGRQHRRPTATG